MERHKLWDDRAGKLMERTFEKFGYGKKKEPVKEEKKKEIKENLQEAPRYGEDYADMDGDDDGGNSLLDMDDYNMLEKAIEGPVRKLISGGHTKEDLLDAFKVMLGFENVNENDFNTTTQLSKDMDKATASADKRMGRVASRISTIAKLQDVLVSYTRDLMKDAEKVGEKELTLVLRKMLKNVGQLVSSGEGAQNENETENPEVDRAEDAARKAKIKALQVQLKALQKTQSME